MRTASHNSLGPLRAPQAPPPPVHCSKPGVTNATSEYPQTARLLTAYMKQCQPTFLFTSIQINVGHAAKPHVDSNNLGSSLGIAFGSWH